MAYALNLTEVVSCLTSDVGVSIQDRKYVLRRFKSEGTNFLTVLLPRFSKHVIASLESGSFIADEDESAFIFGNFGRKKCLSRFFWCELVRIFDSNGSVLADVDAFAVRRIRRVCEYLYKLALPYTEEQLEKSTASFIKNEEELKELVEAGAFDTAFTDQLRKDFVVYWSPMCTSIDKVFSSFGPRDTSGSFVEGGCESYLLRRETGFRSTVPRRFGGHVGFYPTGRDLTRRNANRRVLLDEPSYSELLFVPKDSRGPRSICREFPHRLRTQMAFFDWATQNMCTISDGAINFLDQGVNRRLAESSSVDGKFSTLDLKDASDRVSYYLLRKIVSGSSAYSIFLRDSRARKVGIPGGKCTLFAKLLLSNGFNPKLVGQRCFYAALIYCTAYTNDVLQKRPLYKVAGMGSGLTFPSMSLVISMAITREVLNRGLCHLYKTARSLIYVYGDDIVLPTKWFDAAKCALAKVGLRVNTTKSFHKGLFRESCGGDYFNGVSVVPLRLRLANSKPLNVAQGYLELDNSDNTINQLYKHLKECFTVGYHLLGKYLVSVIENCIQARGYKFKNYKLPAGAFIETSPYMVNPYKGSAHYHPDQQVEALLPVSECVRLDPTYDVFRGLKPGNRFIRRGVFRLDESNVHQPVLDIEQLKLRFPALAAVIGTPDIKGVYDVVVNDSPEEIRERAMSVLYPRGESDAVVGVPHKVRLAVKRIPAWQLF